MKTDIFEKYLVQAFDEDPADETTETDDTGAKTYTEDEVNSIVEKRLARERKDAEKKRKAANEAERLEQLTAEQKLQERADALQRKIEELEARETKAQMAATARKILGTEKINIPDELVGMLITDEAETTQENVTQFIKVFKQAVQDGIAEKLKGKAPKTGAAATLSKDDINKIKDPIARQKAIRENLSLYQ